MNNLKGELLCLKAEGIKPNYSELGRIYHMDRRSVKKQYLNIRAKERKKRVSKLDKYKNLIKEKISIPGTNKKAVYMYIKMNVDENIGSYSNFRKYVNKQSDIINPKSNISHPRYETKEGQQLQFDWKGPIKLYNKNNELFEFYIFSTTLGYSRLHSFIYSKFMTLESVERCLIEVFTSIGGVAKECLTDNMSSIVINSRKDFTESFKNFAKDMGFTPKKCKKNSPETKGKDESCNRFMSWLYPYDHEFETEEELIEILKKLNMKINEEINETTNMKPIVLFRKEKEYLNPLPRKQIIEEYLDTMIPAKVSNGLLVHYKGKEYSVPLKFINQTVKLNEVDNKLYIYYNKQLIVTHEITNKKINYKEEHYKESLKSSMSYKTDDEIETLTKENLERLNQLIK